jgi:hypothetical protein
MKNLAMSQIMTGANFWDAPGHSMAGSNDLAVRKEIFTWIHRHEKTFFRPRSSIHPVGVYFSPDTRNVYADDFIRSYRGILLLLIQSHLEFQVVTPRTLAFFTGKTLVLPGVRMLNPTEKASLASYVNGDNRLVITGADVTGLGNRPGIVRFPDCPGKAYLEVAEQDFARADPNQQQSFLKSLAPDSSIAVSAGPLVATSISSVDGAPHVFLANFTGLVGGVNPVQTPQQNVRIVIEGGKGTTGHFLPFLGDQQTLRGSVANGRVSFTLPAISKGAVFWYGDSDSH